jgi:ABC-2 type transport system ATP-binding protein
VLLTTQYLEEADELADLIGVIDHGSIITEGTADELKDSLGDNTVQLLVHDDDLDAARQVLGDLDRCTDRNGGRFEIRATNGNQTVMTVLRRLDAEGIEPLELALERPTLDDVFLTLTGHRAANGGGGPGDDDRGKEDS